MISTLQVLLALSAEAASPAPLCDPEAPCVVLRYDAADLAAVLREPLTEALRALSRQEPPDQDPQPVFGPWDDESRIFDVPFTSAEEPDYEALMTWVRDGAPDKRRPSSTIADRYGSAGSAFSDARFLIEARWQAVAQRRVILLELSERTSMGLRLRGSRTIPLAQGVPAEQDVLDALMRLFPELNRPPVPRVQITQDLPTFDYVNRLTVEKEVSTFQAFPGVAVHLDASASEDPEGETLTSRWVMKRGGSTTRGEGWTLDLVPAAGEKVEITWTVEDGIQKQPLEATLWAPAPTGAELRVTQYYFERYPNLQLRALSGEGYQSTVKVLLRQTGGGALTCLDDKPVVRLSGSKAPLRPTPIIFTARCRAVEGHIEAEILRLDAQSESIGENVVVDALVLAPSVAGRYELEALVLDHLGAPVERLQTTYEHQIRNHAYLDLAWLGGASLIEGTPALSLGWELGAYGLVLESGMELAAEQGPWIHLFGGTSLGPAALWERATELELGVATLVNGTTSQVDLGGGAALNMRSDRTLVRAGFEVLADTQQEEIQTTRRLFLQVGYHVLGPYDLVADYARTPSREAAARRARDLR